MKKKVSHRIVLSIFLLAYHFSVIVFSKSSIVSWTCVIIRRSVASGIACSLIGSVRRVMIVVMRRSRIWIVWAVCVSREMFVQQLSNVFSRLNVIYICFWSKAHFGERVELRLKVTVIQWEWDEESWLTGALGIAPYPGCIYWPEESP